MSILVDHEIRTEIAKGNLILEPYDDKLIQPNSYDVRLAEQFSWHDPSDQIIDPYKSDSVLQGLVHVVNDSIVIHPKQFVLGATLEKMTLPDDIVGQLTGKSSLARLGVMVHVTAGFIDAGFSRSSKWHLWPLQCQRMRRRRPLPRTRSTPSPRRRQQEPRLSRRRRRRSLSRRSANYRARAG